MNLPELPDTKRGGSRGKAAVYDIPPEIRPQLTRYRLEVTVSISFDIISAS